MNGGIDQLVDTYKGNPQPLAQKVQKAQQGQPPGEVPADLEEAIALQKIAELRNSAQGQQAMQAGGAQQSVVDKLRQMLGGMQQQAQMQGQPVMAASGGSLDQLMSNLGQYYAGGGIVAFTSGGSMPLSGEFSGFGGQTPEQEAETEVRGADVKRAKEIDALERKVAFLESADARQAPEARAQLEALKGGTKPKPPPTQPDTSTTKTSAAPAAKVPPTANVNLPAAPAKPVVEPMDPMEKVIRDSIMKTMAQDPDAVRRKAIDANRQDMGLDALLKPMQDRVATREARIKEIQDSRQPLWIDALMSASKPTRGGIAGVLQNMAVGAISGKQNYEVEDLKFLDELSKLSSEIDKAKIEGRYKDVAAGKEAVKDLISEKKQAEASGTSLLNTKENVRSREQIARDAAAARAQSASQHAQNQALALEERRRQFNESELRKIREKDVDRANKIETAIAKRTAMIDMSLQSSKLKPEEETALLARRNTIVKQVQAEYPPIKPEKPSESQFLTAARAEPGNKDYSDEQLKAFYKQKYGS